MKTLLITLALLLNTGCQAMLYGTGADFERVSLGMNRADVVQALGPPRSTGKDSDKDEETLLYSKMAQTLGWAPTSYQVLLRHGQVVSFGETTH